MLIKGVVDKDKVHQLTLWSKIKVYIYWIYLKKKINSSMQDT